MKVVLRCPGCDVQIELTLAECDEKKVEGYCSNKHVKTLKMVKVQVTGSYQGSSSSP